MELVGAIDLVAWSVKPEVCQRLIPFGSEYQFTFEDKTPVTY
jgi:hypothetical protein